MRRDKPARMSERRVSISIEEPLLVKWKSIARSSKRLHDAARSHLKKKADGSFLAALILGSGSAVVNMVLGVLDTTMQGGIVVNFAQIVLGACGVVSAGIMSTSKHMAWDTKASLHEQYAGRYSEIVRMINTEATLERLNDSSFASQAEFIKALQAELDRIEDGAPPIPSCIEEKVGLKSASSNGD